MLTLYTIYFSQKPRICSVCRSCNPAILYFMIYHQSLPRVAWQVPLLEQEQAVWTPGSCYSIVSSFRVVFCWQLLFFLDIVCPSIYVCWLLRDGVRQIRLRRTLKDMKRAYKDHYILLDDACCKLYLTTRLEALIYLNMNRHMT